jgi:chorismate synthase
MIRYLTAGESHGKCLTGILEGMPAGLAISDAEIASDLTRRQLGYGRGERMTIEADHAQILAGVRYGLTLGSPISLLIENKDWANWQDRMAVEAVPEEKRAQPLTTPRPGHADFAGAVKYQQRDIRNIIERSSARETAMRVALGAVCRKFLREAGITVGSHVIQIGNIRSDMEARGMAPDEINRIADGSPVRCLDKHASDAMIRTIDAARERGDTVGGVFEVIAHGLPIGLGSMMHPDRRLDTLLAAAVMSIPAIKAVGFGLAEDAAAKFGSEMHDQMYLAAKGIVRKSNHAGGIEGGMSTGEPLVIRAAMKPLSTLGQPLDTVDLATQTAAVALRERSDVCAVPSAAVVAEAVVMLALMNPFLEKFGGDSMTEIMPRIENVSGSPWL